MVLATDSPGTIPEFHLQQYAFWSRKKSGSRSTPWVPFTVFPNEVEGRLAAEQTMGGGGGGLDAGDGGG